MKPTPAAERIKAIDVWRGFALLGVAIGNFPLRNLEFLSSARASLLPTAGFDWKFESIAAVLFYNKSHTLFALLFGVGFAIIIERSGSAHVDARRILLRRMLILLLIGWLHFLLLYSGEELHVYALCGLVLLACRNLSDRQLLTAGLLLAFIPRLGFEEWSYFQHAFGLDEVAGAPRPLLLDDPDSRYAFLHDDARFDYLTLNLTLALNGLRDWLASLVHLLYFLGRVLLGFALWRSGWIRRLVRARSQDLTRVVVASGSVVLALTLATQGTWGGSVGSAAHVMFNAMRQANILATAFFYAAALTLLCRGGATGRPLTPLAAMGRMSLSNYLAQSVFMLVLLAGPGLRLAGDIGSALVIAIAVGVYALQLGLSVAWGRNFSYGPAEWLWRYLTYRGS